MGPNNFTRSSMDTGYAISEGNALSSFKGSDEKKALKQAKEAERAFRESKVLKPDTFWRRFFNKLKKI